MGLGPILWLFDFIPLVAVAIAGLVIAYFLALCALGVVLWIFRNRGDEVPQPLADEGWFDRLAA